MGSLIRRGRRWEGRYRDAAGARHSRTFDRRAEGAAWLAEQERDVRRGRHIPPRAGRRTLRDFEADWWAARVTERSTQATDAGRLAKHILPVFGSTPLDAITPTMIQGWVRRLTNTLAPATVRSCYQLLASILGAAVRDGLLVDTPARGVTLPTVPPGRETYLSRDQVQAVAEHLDPDDRVVFLLLAYTGMRWGEVAGLHVNRLDLLRGQVTVAETLVEVGRTREVKAYPKGKRQRTVPLTRELVDELAAYLTRNPRGRDELLFTVSRSTWGRWRLQPALRAAGVPVVRVHDLRHTYASWLVQDGLTLPEVAVVLGHSSISTTMRYAHLAPGTLDRVRETLESGSRLSVNGSILRGPAEREVQA